MHYGNCLFYAISRFLLYGGRIGARRSHWTILPFPHFYWTDGRRYYQFVPPAPKRRWFPPPLFSGVVRISEEKP